MEGFNKQVGLVDGCIGIPINLADYDGQNPTVARWVVNDFLVVACTAKDRIAV